MAKKDMLKHVAFDCRLGGPDLQSLRQDNRSKGPVPKLPVCFKMVLHVNLELRHAAFAILAGDGHVKCNY